MDERLAGRATAAETTSPTKNVWSPAGCSDARRHSTQPIAPSSRGAPSSPSRVSIPVQSPIGGTPRAKCCARCVLSGRQDAHGEAAGLAEQLVERGLPAERDAEERRLERERDEGVDREPGGLTAGGHRDHATGAGTSRIKALSSSPATRAILLA